MYSIYKYFIDLHHDRGKMLKFGLKKSSVRTFRERVDNFPIDE